MKREYFGMLFIIAFVGIYFIADYFLGEEAVNNYVSRFIVIWLLLAINIGQYSMKYPKAF